MPIIEFINETWTQGPNLIPKDPIKRAKARAIAEIINSGIQPYHQTSVAKRIGDERGEEKKNEWVKFYIRKGFVALEEALKETSGKYCVGDEVTIADLFLVPQVILKKYFNSYLYFYVVQLLLN